MALPRRYLAASMLRLFHVGFARRTVLLALTEAGLILIALAAAGWMTGARLAAGRGRSAGAADWPLALVALLGVLCLYYCDLYDSAIMASSAQCAARLVQALGLLCLAAAGLNSLLRPGSRAQAAGLFGILLAGATLAAWRGLFRWWNHSARLGQPTLLFGEGPLATLLAAEIQRRPELGLKLVGCFTASATPGGEDGERLLAISRRQRVSRIVITLDERRGPWPAEELLRLKNEGVHIEDGAETFEAITGRIPVETLRYSQILFARGFSLSAGLRLYKRTTSLLLAVLGLALAAPLLLAAAVAIRLDSPGPVIFRQRRVGWRGELFTLYKFRSMYAGADAEGNFTPAVAQDRRVTRVGRWLRRTRWDELPQLFNVLRGDMYFVGPRPFVPNQERELEAQIPFYRQRWAVRPGATGWAQVHRGYCATRADNEEKLSYDLFYIKNMSFGLDLLILLQTVKILLLGRGGR